MIKASHTDILVIALSTFPFLQNLGLQQLWVAFAHGVSLRWIGVHDLYHVIRLVKDKGILFFHAFTYCISVLQQRQKDCQATLGHFPKDLSHLQQTKPVLSCSD